MCLCIVTFIYPVKGKCWDTSYQTQQTVLLDVWKTIALVSTAPTRLHCYFKKEKHNLDCKYSPHLGPPVFFFFSPFPAPMYRSVCEELMGGVGKGGSLGWREECLPHFSAVIQFAKELFRQKKEKKANGTGITKVLGFVMFLFLCPTHFLVHQTQWVSWMGSEFMTMIWSTKDVPCTFPGNDDLGFFSVFCPCYFNTTRPYIQCISITCPHKYYRRCWKWSPVIHTSVLFHFLKQQAAKPEACCHFILTVALLWVCFIDLLPDDLITSQLLLGSGFINNMEVYDSQDQKADAD